MALPSLPSSPPGTNHPFNTEKSYVVAFKNNMINITYFRFKCNTAELSTRFAFINHIIIKNHVYIRMFSASFQYNLYLVFCIYPGRRFFMPQNRIRELRQKKNLSQLQLSIELEVTQETISAYEHSKHLPSVTSLMKMSQLFGVSMDYIMGLSYALGLLDSESR